MTLQTLLLLQSLLANQQIHVSAPDEEIAAVLQAKRELAEAIEEAQKSAGS